MAKPARRYYFYIAGRVSSKNPVVVLGQDSGAHHLALHNESFRNLQSKRELPAVGDKVALFYSGLDSQPPKPTHVIFFGIGVVSATPRTIPDESARPNHHFRNWLDVSVKTQEKLPMLARDLGIELSQIACPVLVKANAAAYSRATGWPVLRQLEKKLKKFEGQPGLVWDSRLEQFLSLSDYLEKLPDEDLLEGIALRFKKPNRDSFHKKIEEISFRTTDRELSGLSWQQFERLCTRIVERYGFVASRRGQPGDQGIDIIAEDKGDTFRRGLYLFQCKHMNKVGSQAISMLVGTVEREKAMKGVLLTSGFLTKAAAEEAKANPRIEIVDGLRLRDMLKKLFP